MVLMGDGELFTLNLVEQVLVADRIKIFIA